MIASGAMLLYAVLALVAGVMVGAGLSRVVTEGDGVVQAPDPARQIRMLLQGIQGATIAGTVYSSPMPPFGIALSDRQVADIIDHERTSWGNHAPLATAREVAAVRATLKH